MKFESSDPPRVRMESDLVEDMDGLLASFFVQTERSNKRCCGRDWRKALRCRTSRVRDDNAYSANINQSYFVFLGQ